MSKTIWKYPLTVPWVQYISMPKDAEILTIQVQDNIPCLWALVDPDEKKQTRAIEIFGTGHSIDADRLPGNRKYISTFQIMENGMVFHVFEYLGLK